MPEDLHGSSDSREFARWQGAIDSDLKEHTRRLDNINGDIREIKHTMNSMEKDLSRGIGDLKVTYSAEMASLKAKVGVFSAVGGLVGAGAVSLLFSILAK